MKLATAVLMSLFPAIVVAQAPDVRSLFEAGKHQQVVEAASETPDPDPAVLYMAALSYQKLSNGDEAKAAFARLEGRPEDDPWHFIGESGRLLADGNVAGALAAVNKAILSHPTLAQAHYQAGLVYGQKNDFAKAAAAFDKAAKNDPEFAYAHYHAGLSYYKAKRVDMMATHFESFLKLAPDAPERAEVESIMRTVRGR